MHYQISFSLYLGEFIIQNKKTQLLQVVFVVKASLMEVILLQQSWGPAQGWITFSANWPTHPQNFLLICKVSLQLFMDYCGQCTMANFSVSCLVQHDCTDSGD